MFGVVLWSGDGGHKAVIWCEDHGDLAFFHDPEAALSLEAGDMVRFRTEKAQRVRLARDIELIEQNGAPGLPEALKQAQEPEGQVVPFKATQRALVRSKIKDKIAV